MLTGSIRARLALAIGLLLAMLLTVAAIAFLGFQSLMRAADELVDRQARYAFLATRVNQHAQAASGHLLRLLLTEEREARVPMYAAMDAALAMADQALAQLENAARDGSLAADAGEVEILRRRYEASFQETVEQIELAGPMSALQHFERVTEPALKALLAGTDRLAVAQQDVMQATVENLDHAAEAARRRILGVALAALAAALALAAFVARRIVRPVNQATQLAEGIAGGDYAQPIPQGGRDEVGSMLRALGAMRERIAQREAHITRIAYEDALTGLPNRARFFEAFAAAAARGGGALLLVNIDRFAPINKALGHGVGDCLLREVAGRLRAALADGELAARFAGDEFALWLGAGDREAAAARAESLLDCLRQPIEVAGQRLDLDASAGLAIFPGDGGSLHELLRRADLGLRAAKRRHARLAFGGDFAETDAPEQLSLIGAMRAALAAGQFVAWYQPKLDLATRRVTAAEALIRWRHPERGLVPPGQFIPFAEQTGFISEITPWLVRQVIADAAAWQAGGHDLVLSANLSTHDLLNEALIASIPAMLAEAGVPAHRLCLEITESALMDEPERALGHLERLAALGLKLAIDDYGSGQASLAYVKNLPVHELKIDRVFVTDVHRDARNAAIVQSTALLCRSLGLQVVAEGAETGEEIDWLAAQGVDLVQGYGVARPMPAEDFIAFVARVNGA